jgi:hypothetical protein
MTTLKPTDDRIALARGIKAGEVIDHGWAAGHITWREGLNEHGVTGRVGQFRAAGLLEPPGQDGVKPPYKVKLNPDGEAWLAEHGGGVA